MVTTEQIDYALKVCRKATPGPWHFTLSGDAGIYTGLTVKSLGCISYDARILSPGCEDYEATELIEAIDDGEVTTDDLTEQDKADIRFEDNLKFAALARDPETGWQACLEELERRGATGICRHCTESTEGPKYCGHCGRLVEWI
jgi:hypothetical protein